MVVVERLQVSQVCKRRIMACHPELLVDMKAQIFDDVGSPWEQAMYSSFEGNSALERSKPQGGPIPGMAYEALFRDHSLKKTSIRQQ